MKIDGVNYCSANELASELDVSRQTLWRWRQGGKIPAGHRFRDGRILFTAEEATAVRNFANRIEPAAGVDPRQLSLFRRG